MFQSKERLLELNARLADNLIAKGVNASASETTTNLVDKVADISINKSDDSGVLSSLIDRSATEIIIPEGVTKIGNHIFYMMKGLLKVTFPDTLVLIGAASFQSSGITEITLPPNLNSIESNAFSNCNINTVVFPKSLKTCGSWAFRNCTKLTTLYIPATIEQFNVDGGLNSFDNCSALRNVDIENGFNGQNLMLKSSTLFSKETIVSWLNALADRSGQSSYTLTINETNLDKLTEDDIAIATAKNWTLA